MRREHQRKDDGDVTVAAGGGVGKRVDEIEQTEEYTGRGPGTNSR